MTLLVLDIHIPSVHAGAALGPALIALLPRIAIFALSFLAVAFYWVTHHIVFAAIAKGDRQLLWFNLLFLMTIILLPLSTAVLGEYPDTVAAVLTMAINIFACGLSLAAAWLYASGNRRLIAPTTSKRIIGIVTVRLLLYPASCLVATAVALVSTRIATVIFIVVPLYYVVTGPRRAATEMRSIHHT